LKSPWNFEPLGDRMGRQEQIPGYFPCHGK
jgi:hypothetical protein